MRAHAISDEIVIGNIDIALYGQQKPITVANFLKYVDQGRYFVFDPTAHQTASSFVHRSIPGFVIQGGGYTYDAATMSAPHIAQFGQVNNVVTLAKNSFSGSFLDPVSVSKHLAAVEAYAKAH